MWHTSSVLLGSVISKASLVLRKRKIINVELGNNLGSYVTYVLHTARITA